MKKIFLLILCLLLCAQCKGSCIAQWKMNDDAASATVIDSKGSHNGTFYDENTPVTVTSDHNTTGQVNGGLEFDGTNDYITFLDHADFSPALSTFSITVWISMVGVNSAVEFEILNKMETNKNEWRFHVSGDALSFAILDEVANAQIGRKDTDDYSAWEDAGFIFVAATYDGGITDGGIKLYLNGSQVDDANDDNSPESFVTVRNNDAVLRMGLSSGSPNKASGIIDNVMVFNQELTASQISRLYNNGNGTENSNVVAAGSKTRRFRRR